ncbi:MAG: Maf family nucleotide pyrophosphatase [Alphaproteobacteria bacterium]|nr:Maf family nucleotide pyrophosphatase [Alphaproteobacteria bacterium]
MSKASPPIILASQSANRKKILEMFDLPFQCLPANIDETPLPNEDPRIYVKRMALEKVETIQKTHPESLIISGDTIGYKSHKILQKPQSPEEALEMMDLLNNTRHQIMTGMCLALGNRRSLSVTVTRIQFRKISQQAMRKYIQSNEWNGLAAGWGLHTKAYAFVKSINGSPSALPGLPVSRLATTLISFGIQHEL